MRQFLVFIFGATASGKSDLAHSLAKETSAVVVNGDSRQLYRDIPILTASPDASKMKEVPHRLYQILQPNETPNVLWWMKRVRDLISRGKPLVIVGGSGLYFHSLLNGLSPIPDIPQSHRKACEELLHKKGVDSLAEEMERKGAPPTFLDRGRILRAYEVLTHTGKSVGYWQNQPRIGGLTSDPGLCLIPRLMFCPMWERQELYRRADLRCEAMMRQGLLEEIREVERESMSLAFRSSIGMKVLLDLCRGKIRSKDALDLFQREVRHYIKRQLTWLAHKINHPYTPIFPECVVSFSRIVRRRLEAIC